MAEDEPRLYGFESINRQNPQHKIQYPIGAGGLKPVYPELWLLPLPKIGIINSLGSKALAGFEHSGGGKALQWMARVQPASERALVLNTRKPMLPGAIGNYAQISIANRSDKISNFIPKIDISSSYYSGLYRADIESVTVPIGTKEVRQLLSERSVNNFSKVANGENIFPNSNILPYTPRHAIYGQYNSASCAASSCKMVLSQFGFDAPEAYIRQAIGTKADGT